MCACCQGEEYEQSAVIEFDLLEAATSQEPCVTVRATPPSYSESGKEDDVRRELFRSEKDHKRPAPLEICNQKRLAPLETCIGVEKPDHPARPGQTLANQSDLLETWHVSNDDHANFFYNVFGMQLCHAACSDDLTTAQALVAKHANVNSVDYELRTPLHVAAGAGSLSVLRFLLESRAQVNLLDVWQMSPLYQAEKGGHSKAAQMLREAGASVQVEQIKMRAKEEHWLIPRANVQVGKELCSTNKSTVYVATWLGAEVVAKFPKVPESKMRELWATDCDAVCLSPQAKSKRSRAKPNWDPPAIEHFNEQEMELVNEIAIIATLHHPDLVMFLGADLNQHPIMFITEYMHGGDLEHYYLAKRNELQKIYRPSLSQVVRWASAVARALSFLHTINKPIVHRDLKPLNLLLGRSLELKVCDFGISKMATETYFSDEYKMTGGVGSWLYMAPEIVRGKHYTEKVDIFSFGLIMYFMASGRDPFWHLPSKEPDACLKEYLRGDEPRPKASECYPPLRPIMELAWHIDPDHRPSAADLTESIVGIHASSKECCLIS